MRPLLLFGGTFDPVHHGHLRPALEVMQALGLDRINLLPAHIPPHREAVVASVEHRLQMLRLATRGVPGLVVDTREIDRGGPSYTCETLAEIRSTSPGRPLILVLGQDSANTLHTWHEWRTIPELAHLVIMSRPGDGEDYVPEVAGVIEPRRVDELSRLTTEPAGAVLTRNVTGMGISSSGIRAMIRTGQSPRFLLPDPVLEYILKNRLYK